MIATTERRYSLEEYRAIAETSTEKCEYHDGEIITMTGGTLNHSRICGNIFSSLKFLLRNTKLEPINSDLRLWIPEYSRGVYPDAMVFDGFIQLNGDRQDEVLNPILIVEVLSPSTEEHDRTNKFRMYRSIPSFCEYLLVRQNKPFVELYSKQSEGWIFSDFDSLENSISLNSLNIELAISEIYRGILF
ncbi:Uma2 family endonuclease [Pseudanabaena sp. FACHB-1998]|uniref:Uma2 family endonuclease n=1 Tax=Pseudanabaena sp. FACHB-1998 TaxID=2692858 RepID=UPI0016808098|nr:Uma2 family endonuclease [Pseudanabaena sp. FACHB-1998]MBD2178332.1 Uma2 family endonuclease [Pseudanabaena sp. FACHB-1998]